MKMESTIFPTVTSKRSPHLYISVIILVITVLTDHTLKVHAQNQAVVDTEPSEVVLLEGDKTSLLCRSGLPVNYCRIKIPGEEILNLSPDWDQPGFSYYGEGLKAGQCGVTIQRVSARNHGQVECNLGIRGGEATGKINLIVALSPNSPEIAVSPSTQSRGNVFEMNTIFKAKCIVRDGRPAANITWFLDNEPIYDGLGRLEEVQSLDISNTTLITTMQEIQRTLTPNDNGRTLICRASHIADHGDRPNETKFQLFVRYGPQPLPDSKVYGLTLGSTAFINVTIEANPKPRVEWTVDGVNIPQGTQNGRYEAYEPIDLGNGFYNVTLSVAGLTLEDTNKDYYFRASNELGLHDYTVRISSSNTPASNGLDVGAIVGIVVGLVILLIIVLLIIFARATGRWCFAAKSSKTTANETLDEVQYEGNSALLYNSDNSNFNNSSSPAKGKRKARNGTNSSAQGRSDHILLSRGGNVYNSTTVPNDDLKHHKGKQKHANYSSVPSQQSCDTQLSSTDMKEDGAGGGDGIKMNSNNNYNDNNKNNNNNRSRNEKINQPIVSSSENVNDLLEHGNELGIPESRCSKWIPKDQRELLEKQAKLLVNREGKSTVIF